MRCSCGQTREELLPEPGCLSRPTSVENRLLRELSMNEMLVCNLLYRRQEEGGPPVTATELCARTQLLKSQVNHILTAMESRGLIERARSQADRRVVHIHLLERALPLYRRDARNCPGHPGGNSIHPGRGADTAAHSLMDEAVAAVNLHQKQRR